MSSDTHTETDTLELPGVEVFADADALIEGFTPTSEKQMSATIPARPRETVHDERVQGASSIPKWGSTPSPGQFTDPDTWRPKNVVPVFFNIPEDIESYQKLLSRTFPEDSPEIVIRKTYRKESTSGWQLFVEYTELEYMQIDTP